MVGMTLEGQGSASSLLLHICHFSRALGEFGQVVSLKKEEKVGVQLGNSLPMNLLPEEQRAWLLSRY